MTRDNRSGLDRRTVLGVTGAGILGLGAVSATAADEDHDDESDDESDDNTNSGGYDVDEILDDWDEKPTEIAETTIDEHGEPDEVVPSRLIWHQEDDDGTPWKRTELFRDPVPHNFPVEHPDHLEQFIDVHVPPDQYDEVASFDGSVMLERTKGEVSARCDKEPMNFLAVNLAHELVTTDVDVEAARREYAEDAMAFMDGEEPPRTQGIQFDLPEDDQRDPDVSIVEDGEIEMDRDEEPESGDAEDEEPESDESEDGESENGESEDDE